MKAKHLTYTFSLAALTVIHHPDFYAYYSHELYSSLQNNIRHPEETPK